MDNGDGAGLAALTAIVAWFGEVTTGALSFVAAMLPGRQTLGMGMIFLLLLPIGAFMVIGRAAQRAEGDTPFFDTALPIVYAGLSMLALVIIWNHFRSFREILFLAAGIIPLAALTLVLMWYFQHRQTVGREAAVRRTRRTTERNFRSYAEFLFGIAAIVLAAMIGIFQGGLEAWGTVGDSLAGFLPEMSYMLTVTVGYLALGGSLLGRTSDALMQLSPGWYVGIALFIGGIAMALRD